MLSSLYHPPKPSWGSGCYSRDKIVCTSTAKFLPSLTSFHPKVQIFLWKSFLYGFHVAIFLHKTRLKQILYEILLKKINKTGKALLGLGPHKEGTEWHRVSHWLFPFSYKHESWAELFLWHTRHQSETPCEQQCLIPGDGDSPHLASHSHLNAITAKGPLDLWHKLQLWWSEKLFSLFYGDLAIASARFSYFGLYFSSSLPWDINTDSRREMTLLSSYFNCLKLLLSWHPPNKTPFQNTDFLAIFPAIFFSGPYSMIFSWGRGQPGAIQWETHLHLHPRHLMSAVTPHRSQERMSSQTRLRPKTMKHCRVLNLFTTWATCPGSPVLPQPPADWGCVPEKAGALFRQICLAK